MSGEFYGLLTALLWAVGIFPFAHSTKYFSANDINVLRLFIAVLMLSPFIPLHEGLSLTDLFTTVHLNQWLWLGLSGLVGLALGDYFSFSAFKHIGARNSSIFSTLAPGAALFFGFFVTNESLNFIGIFGILVTLLGLIFMSLQKKDHQEPINFIGITHAVGAAVCQGIGIVLAKKAYINEAISISPFHAAWIRITVALCALLFYYVLSMQIRPLLRNTFKRQQTKGWMFLLTGTLIGTVLGLAFAMQSVSKINSALAQTIFSLVPVLAIPLAYLFHRERITRNVLSSALVAVAGVIILIWREAVEQFMRSTASFLPY